MGAKLAKNEIIVRIRVNSGHEWTYSSKFSSKRITFKKHGGEWFGLFSSSGTVVDAELEHDSDAPVTLRMRFYKKDSKGSWNLCSDQIYNVKGYFFHPDRSKMETQGVFKIHTEAYEGKEKVLSAVSVIEICRPLKSQ